MIDAATVNGQVISELSSRAERPHCLSDSRFGESGGRAAEGSAVRREWYAAWPMMVSRETMTPSDYNSPRMLSFHRLLFSTIALLCSSLAQASNTWDAPASDLARQIAALTGPGTITLTVTNRSALSNDDAATIRNTVERELRAAGITLRAKDANSDVRITLSQNLQGWLWVAEVQEGSEVKVAMLPVAGSTLTGAASSTPAITLRVNLLFAQAAPILDLAILAAGNDQRMIVLDPEHIKIYNQTAGSWQQAQTFAITHASPFPRDLRGHIVPSTDHPFDAYLPGAVCAATRTGNANDLTLACNDSDDPWPLGSQRAFYNSTRDFFTGVLTPGFGRQLAPFYSAAELRQANNTAFVFVDVSGAAHILDANSTKSIIGARDWGSDIAVVRSECGAATQVLTSAAGWPASDSLRAYEISGHEATPVSAPWTFDGGIVTALWTAIDGASATVIVEKQQENRYEAYSAVVACGR